MLLKRIYDADVAEKLYQAKLVPAELIPIKVVLLLKIERKIDSHMEDGKSINNFLMTNPKLAFISPATVYRYYNYGYFDIKPDDITKKEKEAINCMLILNLKLNTREGRTYQDYLKELKAMTF